MYAFICSFAWILSLTASSTTAEKALWLVRYDKKEKKFEINENALSNLAILPNPIKVISAIGEARVGKSTTLNFVRHIWNCNGKHGAEIQEEFQTGDSDKAVTYGIWMSACEKENIVLLDVEGTNLGNDAVTSHMSVFTSLMSSGIVVFSPETIKNDILDFLYEITRLSEHIFKDIDETNNFGHLHIVIRGGLRPSEGTFEDRIKGLIVKPSGEDEATDNKRRAIAKHFHEEKIAVSVIPYVANRELLKDIEIKKNVEYWNAISVLSQSLKKFPSKMSLGGKYVDGEALVKIARILIDMMNKNSWLDFSDTYLMVEKYLCDKSFQKLVLPVLKLKLTSHEIEKRKESVLKTFKDGCALKEEVNKADEQFKKLISIMQDKEKWVMQLKEAEEAKERAEIEQKNAEKSRDEMEGILKNLNHEIHDLKQKIKDADGGFWSNALKVVVAVGAVGAGIASDARLKENVIILTPSKYEVLRVREVRWTWNKEAEKFGLRGEARGVIAQEVEKLYPWAVVTGTDGYKRVLYKALDYAVDSLQTKRKEDRETS